MKKTMLLIRHAESVGNVFGNVTGTPSDELSEKGILQIKDLKDKLTNREQCYIYSSGAVRAIKTAKLCGFENPMIASELNETNGGDWAARSLLEFNKEHPDFFHRLILIDPILPEKVMLQCRAAY